MSRFMKMLNNISRSQSIYRQNKISDCDLQPSHYSFVLAICREPGRSQEGLARELCINKSNVTRNLNALERRGYIRRETNPDDKRQFSVYPTERMLAVLPEVRDASLRWMELLSEGISEEELMIFDSVLERMELRAREILASDEVGK